MVITQQGERALALDSVVARVEHVDVDSYGVVHFSRYASLIETAVLQFMNQRGISIPVLAGDGYQLRVRELKVRYISAAGLGEILVLSCSLARCGAASIQFDIEVLRNNPCGEVREQVVAGGMNVVVVDSGSGRPVPIPRRVSQLLSGEGA